MRRLWRAVRDDTQPGLVLGVLALGPLGGLWLIYHGEFMWGTTVIALVTGHFARSILRQHEDTPPPYEE